MKRDSRDKKSKKEILIVQWQKIKEKWKNVPKFDLINFMLTILIAVVTIVISINANELAVNDSTLKFNYTKIDGREINTEEDEEFIIEIKGDLQKEDQNISRIVINLGLQIETGRIESLYLVTQYCGRYEFTLLNDRMLKSGRTYTYKETINMDMETGYSLEEDQGIGLIYIVAEGVDGKVQVDVISVTGDIMLEVRDTQLLPIKINDTEYYFESFKQNELITMHDDDFRYSSMEEALRENPGNEKIVYKLYDRSRMIERIKESIKEIRELYNEYYIKF